MRELKFRAFDHIDNVMLFADIYEMQDIQDEWIAWDFPSDSPTNKGTPFEIAQFTGAFDSYSVEMYVDDICAVDGLGNCRVGICPFYGVTFYAKGNNECALIDCIAEGDSFKVIGNAHQNPELLEGNE
jgi:hypothetical protein